jgi:hypothetical protein
LDATTTERESVARKDDNIKTFPWWCPCHHHHSDDEDQDDEIQQYSTMIRDTLKKNWIS